MNIEGFRKKIEYMRRQLETLPDVLERVIGEHEETIIELKRSDFLSGRDGDGEPLSPGYTEDPYFKTKEKAEGYKRMKERLASDHSNRILLPLGYPSKSPNTPNIIVTGRFQDEVFMTRTPTTYTLGSKFRNTDDIEAKYGNNLFKLTPLAREFFRNHYLMEALREHLKMQL